MTIIYSTSDSPAFNLAAEEFLFSKRHDDILFLYVNKPSVIVGCNQAVANEVNLQFCTENNIRIVRRMSGGGAVYHDEGNLNYCFISNRSEHKSVLNSDFLLPIVELLTTLSVPAKIGKRKDLWITGNYKISGTASHIGKTRELHHGTLLYDSKLDALENALSSKNVDSTIKAITSVRSYVKNLRTYLEECGQSTLNSSLFFGIMIQKFAAYFHRKECCGLTNIEIEKINELAENKYLTKEWTYKK